MLPVVLEPVPYSDDAVSEVRAQLLSLDGVLVWVNPIQDGANRALLDRLLREVSAHGVWVSAHPDAILAMGTKEILYRTRDLGWGSDTGLYRSAGAAAGDTYVLCEIIVSAVWPFPPMAASAIAAAALDLTRAARALRSSLTGA